MHMEYLMCMLRCVNSVHIHLLSVYICTYMYILYIYIIYVCILGWWQLKHFFVFFTPIPGEMIQFDEHIFQMGWFSHQLGP